MTFPSLGHRLHSFFLRWQHRFERWGEARIYSDGGAQRFQLPKGLDPRDPWGRIEGRRLQEALDQRRELALQMYELSRITRTCFSPTPIIQKDLDEVWSYFL
jgi:hypothetical protein